MQEMEREGERWGKNGKGRKKGRTEGRREGTPYLVVTVAIPPAGAERIGVVNDPFNGRRHCFKATVGVLGETRDSFSVVHAILLQSGKRFSDILGMFFRAGWFRPCNDVNTYTHTYIYIHMYVYAYTYIYTHIHVYIYNANVIYIYTYDINVCMLHVHLPDLG
jgi:hypothetical protein